MLDRAKGYFSADVLLTNVLCDDDHDHGNKRQFLNTTPLWFPSAEIFPEISHFGTSIPTAETPQQRIVIYPLMLLNEIIQ